jgi:4-amino-4-deoxy-L-arabinose transferase-like glycosyltransferase
MTVNPFMNLLAARPVTLISIVILLKAVVLFAVLPAVQASIAPYYGIDFTDNYELLGRSLSQGNGFRFMADTAPTLMREPGYPLVLAALFSVFGYSLTIARAANLLFGFCSALMVSKLTRRVTGNNGAAAIAPVLFLVHPGLVLAEARGGVESLFIMLLLMYFLVQYVALNSRRLRDYLLAGLVLGVSANVRSTALLFPGFLLLYFVFWEAARPSVVTMITRIAVMMMAAFAVLTPWIIRNYLLVDKFVPTASVAGVSAYAGYHICTHLTFNNTLLTVDADAGAVRAAFARTQGIKFKEMSNHYYLYFYDPHDEIAFNSFLGKQVMDHYRASPSLLATCATKNLFNFWFAGKNWTVTIVNAIVQLPYMVLAVAGLIIGLRGPRKALIAPLLLFIVYTLCVYLPILSQARYSIHLVPFLSLLAAIPIARWWSRRNSA